MMRKILLIFMFLITINSVSSWSSYTHNWICDRAALPDADCANADYDEIQSRYKDTVSVHHHCTNNASDCAAREYAEKQIMYSYPEARGFAAHLYADSMTPVHWYSTDYKTCHKIFEDAVEEKLRDAEYTKYILFGKEYDFSAWNISMQCNAKYGKVNKTVELYADNLYMDSVVQYVAEKMVVDPVLNTEVIKRYDLTPLLISSIVLIILVFVLFFYFGLKTGKDRRKNNR